MFRFINSDSAPIPNLPDQTITSGGGKRFGKKHLIIVAALISIAIIAAAFFIPQSGATIPLNVDFVVGEKMVYD